MSALLPSDLQRIIDLALAGALEEHNRAAGAAKAEAGAAINNFAARMAQLAQAYKRGMALPDVIKAVESEREALGFTLAAIARENAPALALEVLQAALGFLVKLLGARR